MWRFLIILFFLSGCGYHFAGTYDSLPQNIKYLYIEDVQNQTTEPGIDTEMERALSNELNLDKRIKLKEKNLLLKHLMKERNLLLSMVLSENYQHTI